MESADQSMTEIALPNLPVCDKYFSINAICSKGKVSTDEKKAGKLSLKNIKAIMTTASAPRTK
ncbi:MAG: hypothetical protein ACOYJX_06530 [Acutalibacteraceae bacterium]